MPTPLDFEDGTAYAGVQPLEERFGREPNPFQETPSPFGQATPFSRPAPAPVAVHEEQPSIDALLPPVAPRGPVETPWNITNSPAVQFGPPDIGAGGAPRGSRVGPAPQRMPGMVGLGSGGLNLSATATVEPDALDLAFPTKVKCPDGHENSITAKKCKDCGKPLGDAKKAAFANMSIQTPEGAVAFLNLSKKDTATRKKLADEGKALPDGSYPIETVSDLQSAITLAQSGHGKVDEAKKLIKKRAKDLGAEDKLPDEWNIGNLAQPEHAATVQCNLADDGGVMQGGMLWKVLCKTGTLALSPGPGQMDMDKPLELTPDLFLAAKEAYDEKAFEHVVIPAKHEDAHDPLANHGTVDALDVLTHGQALLDQRLSPKARGQIASDPDGTLYMLGGLNFTEPDTRGKAERGSILNCSVGFKFNVRPNKLSGKTYPVAIEHVALTQQPWVYGLPAFGTSLSGDAASTAEVQWDGVFLAAEKPEDPPATDTPILPVVDSDGKLPSTPTSGDLSQMPTDTEAQNEHALEQILATLTARAEAAEARAQTLETNLAQTNGALSATTEQLHAETVTKRIKSLQDRGIAPAVLTRVEALLMADKPRIGESADEGLSLSAVVQGADGPETKEFGSVTEVVDFLLSAIPATEGQPQVGTLAHELALAQREGAQELTTEQRTDAIEKRLHPTRFDAEGKRIPKADRR